MDGVSTNAAPIGSAAARDPGLDDQQSRDEQEWLAPLRGAGPQHEHALRALHALLLKAARFEVHRRAIAFDMGGSGELDDLAMQSANDALVAVLARLDSFEGRSRFTTWAYKFGIHIAGIAVRRAAWRDRSLRAPSSALDLLHDRTADPAARSEERELLHRIVAELDNLTPHQRTVLLTLAVDGVPIDVLAERLSTNRNALYKTLHDARRRLRLLVDESEVTP